MSFDCCDVQSEVEERIARIQEHKDVKGLIIVKRQEDKEGSNPQIVKSTMGVGPEVSSYAIKLSILATQARSLVRDLEPKNDLTFLRVVCKKHDMMVAPDKEYFLIVIQTRGEVEGANAAG